MPTYKKGNIPVHVGRRRRPQVVGHHERIFRFDQGVETKPEFVIEWQSWTATV